MYQQDLLIISVVSDDWNTRVRQLIILIYFLLSMLPKCMAKHYTHNDHVLYLILYQ